MDKLNLIDFEKYTITEDGKIFSQKYNRYMLGTPNKDGYLTVCLRTKNKHSKVCLYHRVIWFYFNGEIPQWYEINHKDENKSNNSLSNLELLTRADNMNYGTRSQRAAISNSVKQKGRKFSQKHLDALREANAKKSKPVLQCNLKTNEPIKKWKSLSDIERELKYESIHISRCCRGITKQAYGYGWSYI